MTTASQYKFKILLIRDDARGDVLLTTPAIRAIRKKYPDAQIDYLVKREPGQVLAGNPHINTVFHVENMKALRGARYNLAIDWRDFSSKIPCHADKTVRSYDNPIMRNDTESRVRRYRSGKSFAELYAETAGVKLPDYPQNEFYVSAEMEDRALKKVRNSSIKGDYVALSVDSCWQTKAYPVPAARALVDMLSSKMPVVIIGKTNGMNINSPGKVLSLANKTTIMEAAAIIKHSSLFVGIDSMPLHIADTFGIPSVSIWTSTDPSVMTDGRNNLSVKTTARCHPCYLYTCKKLSPPTPEAIYNAAEAILKRVESKVYIVMPSYTQTKLTTQSVKSVFDVTRGVDFELILVNDGGPDTHRATCETLLDIYSPQLSLINKENGGFVSSTNAGIAEAMKTATDKDYIIWLNDDIVVKDPDWLKKMIDASAGEKVVGPQGSNLRDDFGHAGYIKSGQCHYIDGWCLFAPAKFYKEDSIGMLDSKIKTFSEDADFCIRVYRAGYDCQIVQFAIEHKHHATFKAIPGAENAHIPSLHYMREKWGNLKKAYKRMNEADFSQREPLYCAICGKTKEPDIELGKFDDFTVVKCLRCGLQRVSERLVPVELEKHYSNSLPLRLTDKWIRNAQRTQNVYWSVFDKYDLSHMLKRGKFLDVGCNLGFMVEIAKSNAWTATGIEYASKFVKECRSKGLDVIRASGLDGSGVTGPFNIITMLDVIEHDPEPAKSLKAAFELLASSGFLALSTPDHGGVIGGYHGIKWEHVRPVEHLWHFTTGTICRMLNDAGFVIDKIMETDEYNYPGARLYLCRKKGWVQK